VFVEGPSYLGAIMVFRALEADVVAVPTDDDGLLTDGLESRLQSGARPKLLYTVPDFQNPGGFSLAADRRRHLLDLADHYGFIVVDDVAYRELWFERPPDSSLWAERPDVTVQIGTFSKVFFPGVRLGWAAGPRPLIAQMVAAKQTTDQCSGALGQRLVETFGRRGGLDASVNRSRAFYAARRDRLLAALEAELASVATWTRPGGGFYSWLTLSDAGDTSELATRAREHRVAFVPGTAFYPDGQGRSSMRLSFSRVSDADIATGVSRLAETLRS
jgi:2-aminoadipate transaminase